jgi:hypothetical protein
MEFGVFVFNLELRIGTLNEAEGKYTENNVKRILEVLEMSIALASEINSSLNYKSVRYLK